MTTTKELDEWKGEFGNDYTERNMLTQKNLEARIAFWDVVLRSTWEHRTAPESLLEVGAGVGGNLVAIDQVFLANKAPFAKLYAIEPNKRARSIITSQPIVNLKLLKGTAFDIPLPDASVDIVFTCGVLIHINPKDVLRALGEIYRVSKKKIVCVEYFSPELREVKYRDREGLLWANDYGKLWLDNFKLHCVNYSFSWKVMSGMDNVTWWAFEKVH